MARSLPVALHPHAITRCTRCADSGSVWIVCPDAGAVRIPCGCSEAARAERSDRMIDMSVAGAVAMCASMLYFVF